MSTHGAGSLPFATVADALAWLDSHIDFESSMPSRRALPTLARMEALMSVLGEPNLASPSLHITGTNGKGSTSAMVTALLMAKGLTVGTYTSPNLHRVHERLATNGTPIDDASFAAVLSELALLEPRVGERPTRFELLTAAALAWFATEAVDAMVIEVGLGGTWDCTNVVHAEVAVLTNISYDHNRDVLGPTLEGIAADKAGIIEPSSTVVIGETAPDLVGIIETRAAEVGAAAAPGWPGGTSACGRPTCRRWGPAGDAVDARRRPLRGRAGPPARGAPGGQRGGGGGGRAGLLRRRARTRRGGRRHGGGAHARGGIEVLAAGHPLLIVDGTRTTWPAWRHWGARWPRSSMSRAPPWRWSACCRAVGDPVAMVRGSGAGRGAHALLRLPARLAARACRRPPSGRGGAGSRVDRARGTRRAARCDWRGLVDAPGMVVVAGSLYVVGINGARRGPGRPAVEPWGGAGTGH